MKSRKRKYERGFSLFDVIIAGVIVDGLILVLIFGVILSG